MKSRLRHTVRLVDSITQVLIEEETAKYVINLGHQQRKAVEAGEQLEDSPETKEAMIKRLQMAYPRLRADADIQEVCAYISDTSQYEYWERQSRDRQMAGISKTYAQTVASFRSEVLNIYEGIQAELEVGATEFALGLADAIRLRLIALEPLLSFWSVEYRVLPPSLSQGPQRLGEETAAKVTICPRKDPFVHLEERMLIPTVTGGGQGQCSDSDRHHINRHILELHPPHLCLVPRPGHTPNRTRHGLFLPHPERRHAAAGNLHGHVPHSRQKTGISGTVELGVVLYRYWSCLLGWVGVCVLVPVPVLGRSCLLCWHGGSSFHVSAVGAHDDGTGWACQAGLSATELYSMGAKKILWLVFHTPFPGMVSHGSHFRLLHHSLQMHVNHHPVYWGAVVQGADGDSVWIGEDHVGGGGSGDEKDAVWGVYDVRPGGGWSSVFWVGRDGWCIRHWVWSRLEDEFDGDCS